jgi:hypothetical protein
VVDKRLSENLTAPIRLRPDEWKSGDILWLVDAIGDGAADVMPNNTYFATNYSVDVTFHPTGPNGLAPGASDCNRRSR